MSRDSEETPLVPRNPSSTETPWHRIYAQSAAVITAIPVSTYVKPLADAATRGMGGSTPAEISANTIVPSAIANIVFVLVGTTLTAMNDWQLSDEPSFAQFFYDRKKEYAVSAAKLYATGMLAFSPYVLFQELGNYYKVNPIGTGAAASAVGIVSFAIFNKAFKLELPADKLIGIATIFVGLTVSNLSWEYAAPALTKLIGEKAYEALTHWAPAAATAAICAGANGVTALVETIKPLKRWGMFGGSENKEEKIEEGNIQYNSSDIDSSTDGRPGYDRQSPTYGSN